ncbi:MULTISPECIES: YbdD/YjiX family protein [Fictibacillus]|uniref:YbdD/YjiX family protein n=1 Tax=Fictibacillus terranigra TaxID=3058424 RepID=A0ABT8EBD9_9BACL|nr:YbdD/YjiX family protein [Fictibacillus sp. CENA-BCM004]MDN4075233.1 YbdD/YjiX family protein [Fictibacillus sp. CENA-BCM004]
MNQFSILRKINGVAAAIRKIGRGISNLPDYDSYVEHIRQHHPEVVPPTEAEFFNDFLNKKYGASAKRCC